MSSIHYKFRSSLESKCHTFDGLHISVAELKKAIYTKEGLREESFELVLSNGHTKRTYAEPNELIPRNSSVIVQRMPRENAGKLPKVQDTSTSGIVQTVLNAADGPKHIGQEEYDKMTEEERIQHMKNVSSFKYQPANFKRQSHIMSQDVPPPPTYICNRCNQPGHWYTHCPMIRPVFSSYFCRHVSAGLLLCSAAFIVSRFYTLFMSLRVYKANKRSCREQRSSSSGFS
ncbi:hypothetical protein L596_009592 [Steinernema carpocapsae]|uniref:DWNN domain-containing protein n=1 Tax=Steinernema carpocapsae TaxID=34508 RepID=A0A4U5PG37_STECR|nr:hypothetical protein L596_009592 [Steinernema carpocapsae]